MDVFIESLQILSDYTVTSLMSYAVLYHPMHDVLLNFNKKYNTWLRQIVQYLAAFFPLEAMMLEGLKIADLNRPCEYIYFCASHVPYT